MADWQDDAVQQVIDASHRRETKAEIVEYYQQTYTGKGAAGWKGQLIGDLLGIRGVTREDVSKAEYQRQYKNLAKRFEPKRINTPEPRNAEEYRLLGESLPLEPPENGYHVHYEGGVDFSPPSTCEPRTFDVDIMGELAEEVAQHPDQVLDIALKIWMQQEGEESSSAAPCDEGVEPEITIAANAADYEPPAVKQHAPAIPFFKRR